jgi:hypothetical protein
MPDFIVGSSRLSLSPSDVVGKGGEADIYRRGGEVFKIFKTPDHADFHGLPIQQEAARARLAEHQQKLPSFPKGLPPHVIVPQRLVKDNRDLIAGYQMPFLADTEVLYRYGQRSFRDQGVSDETTVAVMTDLHRTVQGVHAAGVVIGDFNDLNVLVKGRDAFIIDADSMQFGRFLTSVFTAKFVDPLICDPNASAPIMARPHTADTDWYAYCVMLMQVLLFVGPYGGVYRPAEPKNAVPADKRILRRISVFNPDVIYPKPARHYSILPDTLLDYFGRVFQKDDRGVPPLQLIEGLRFTTCTTCGATHAKSVCPSCKLVTHAMQKEVHTGSVVATKVVALDGVILYATLQEGILRYLYYDGTTYKREGGRAVLTAELDSKLRFRVRGSDTILARGDQAIILKANGGRESISVETYQQQPLVDANASRIFYATSGVLKRTTDLGIDYPERVGDVLANQTPFWVGDTLGFGFYRAAELSNFFVFNTAHPGINDSVSLPPIRGLLIDALCYSSSTHIWFLTSTKEGSQTFNRCYLISKNGEVLGKAEATPGDGSWLGTLRGKFATGDFLLAPTDDGVVRISNDVDALVVSKEYPDTKRFVDSESRLFATRDGLLVVGRHDIWRLVIGTP